MANGKHNYFTKEQLETLYISQNKSIKEMGLILDCNYQTIHNWLKRYDIPRRSYSESLKGRDHSWGEKISQSLKGQKLTEERKNKISKAHYKTGEFSYRKYKKTSCERCFSDKFLIVHHKDENRQNNILSNLETLCRKCHQTHHGEILRCRRKQQLNLETRFS